MESLFFSDQLETHPLRGAIFENLAVVELLKGRYNQAEDPNICFYRENSGRDVDILQLFSDGKKLYEVKAGKTFQPDFNRNLDYLTGVFADVLSAAVVCDGVSRGDSLLNIRDL